MIWNYRLMFTFACVIAYWQMADFFGLGLSGWPLLWVRLLIAWIIVGIYGYILEKSGW